MNDIYTRLRKKIAEGGPRTEELKIAGAEIGRTYEAYRDKLYDLVSAAAGDAFDDHCVAVARAQELLEELDA